MVEYYQLEVADLKLLGIRHQNLRRFMNFTQLSQATLARQVIFSYIRGKKAIEPFTLTLNCREGHSIKITSGNTHHSLALWGYLSHHKSYGHNELNLS